MASAWPKLAALAQSQIPALRSLHSPFLPPLPLKKTIPSEYSASLCPAIAALPTIAMPPPRSPKQ
jgi:hypothetical protein